MASSPDGQGGNDDTEHQQIEPPRTPRPRPRSIHGLTERMKTGHGNMYITINFDEDGKPFEVFSALGKAGGCDLAQLEAISRLVSLALRSGIAPSQVIDQLQGITCCPVWDSGTLVRSSPDAIAQALERQLKPAQQLELTVPTEGPSAMPERQRCPDCNAPVIYQEGFLMCVSCGWNKEQELV